MKDARTPAGPEYGTPVSHADVEVVELAVVLPADRWAALEREAHGRGVAAGPMLRTLIHDFLGQAAAQSRPR